MLSKLIQIVACKLQQNSTSLHTHLHTHTFTLISHITFSLYPIINKQADGSASWKLWMILYFGQHYISFWHTVFTLFRYTSRMVVSESHDNIRNLFLWAVPIFIPINNMQELLLVCFFSNSHHLLSILIIKPFWKVWGDVSCGFNFHFSDDTEHFPIYLIVGRDPG